MADPKTAAQQPLIAVIGVGALGSHFVYGARNLGKFRAVDFDRVESKNTLSQFHGKPSLGKFKTESVKSTMNLLFGIKLEALPVRLTPANARELLAGADLVVDCLDNFESRSCLQAVVRAMKLPCVHGGLSADGTFGRVVWDEEFTPDAAPVGQQATCENGDNLPFIQVTSGLLVQAAQTYLKSGLKVGLVIQPSDVRRV